MANKDLSEEAAVAGRGTLDGAAWRAGILLLEKRPVTPEDLACGALQGVRLGRPCVANKDLSEEAAVAGRGTLDGAAWRAGIPPAGRAACYA